VVRRRRHAHAEHDGGDHREEHRGEQHPARRINEPRGEAQPDARLGHNTDGSLTPITDGRWFGTIGGKKLADFTPTSTTPVLAINVREADLKNITITHTTPEGIKTTLAVVDPQLSREAQTTLFVPTE
ncbi:MAG: hypothetical protein ACFNXY_07330, partial [Corynebacterium matruchotii]|uniref:hypothetical protein n=1 Tax=Corynebacterium matruchotii TaxID=43768 RepID=UPI003618E713